MIRSQKWRYEEVVPVKVVKRCDCVFFQFKKSMYLTQAYFALASKSIRMIQSKKRCLYFMYHPLYAALVLKVLILQITQAV